MTPKISLAVSVLCILLMFGSALLVRDVLALVACLGGLCSGMAIMSAVYRWPGLPAQ